MPDVTVPMAIVVPVVLALAGTIWGMFKSTSAKLDKKLDAFIKACCDCRLGVNDELSERVDWHAFHSHEHDVRGRVVR